MDAWMLRRTGALVRQCLSWYADFEFHRVYHALHDFCVVDLSAFYFDVLKDRLYTFAPNHRGRRSAQTAVYHISRALIRLVAPILVFTSEEVWKHLPQLASACASIHMAHFPTAEHFENALDEARSKDWDRLLEVREEVLKVLESLRSAKEISASLEARVILKARGDVARLLNRYAPFLPGFFIVSQVEIETQEGTPASSMPNGLEQIRAEKAQGSKCERCWNYSTHVGESSDFPTLCERCLAALAEIEREGGTSAGRAGS
jgi:isoleucyl-tRNA synthetase